MLAENKAVVERWFDEVWNEGNEQSLRELLAPTAIIHNLPVEKTLVNDSQAALTAMVRQFRGAFPDLRISVDEAIAEGDRVVARCTVRGTHSGDTLGMPATGQRVQFDGISIARIENGQIVEGWNNFDFLAMFTQLGVDQPANN